MTALKTPQPPQVVITALAQVRTSESPFAPLHPDTSPDFLSSSMRALLAAIEKANPSSQIKIIINSAQGVGASWGSMNFLGRMIFSHGSMAIGLKDHNEVDRLIRSSGVAFVSPRPCLLTEGDSKVVKVWPEDGRGCAWMPKISRASVGKWLLDAAESDEWNGNAPVISN